MCKTCGPLFGITWTNIGTRATFLAPHIAYMKYHKYSNCALKCTDWSLGTIRQLSDATQRCSRSPTKVQNYDNNGRNCTQHSANRIDDYYVTYGHSVHHVEHNAQGTRAVDSGARPPPNFTFGPPIAAYIQYCILKISPPLLVFGSPCC